MSQIFRLKVSALTLTGLLVACQTTNPEQQGAQNGGQPVAWSALVDKAQIRNKEDVKTILALAKEQEYKEASRLTNEALLKDPSDGTLHFLNGYLYQKMSEQGEPAYTSMAEIGYSKALEFDEGNWLASLQLARMALDKRKYSEAQDYYALALLYNPDMPDAYYELALSSYYAYDLRHAVPYIEKALELNSKEPLFYRAAAMIMAASGKQQKAREYLDKYKSLATDKTGIAYVERRLGDWQHLYKRAQEMKAQKVRGKKASRMTLKSASDTASIEDEEADSLPSNDLPTDQDIPAEAETAPGNVAPTGPAPTPTRAATQENINPNTMVIEGVVIRFDDQGSTQKGLNVLNALQTTLNFSYSRTDTINLLDRNNNNKTLSKARGLSIPSVTYGLNIANVGRSYAEIIGRPTMVVEPGQAATFKVGSDFNLAQSGVYSNNINKIESGTTLNVTLQSVEGDIATMAIKVNNTDNLAPTADGILASASGYVEFASTDLDTTIKAKINETIMLAGHQARKDKHTKDGIPFLKDIPILQYLTSQEVTNSSRTAVMFLLTVRPYKETVEAVNKRYFPDGTPKPNLKELDKRQSNNMLDTMPSTPLIFLTFKNVYRDFRNGDLFPLRWHQPDKVENDLASYFTFLWY